MAWWSYQLKKTLYRGPLEPSSFIIMHGFTKPGPVTFHDYEDDNPPPGHKLVYSMSPHSYVEWYNGRLKVVELEWNAVVAFGKPCPTMPRFRDSWDGETFNINEHSKLPDSPIIVFKNNVWSFGFESSADLLEWRLSQ